ncbi:MAG: hypothetical protein NC548_29620 [Lachnospiraceae bacterium]|nr:hypothetical protein [Lachnospiraceae bacterium]
MKKRNIAKEIKKLSKDTNLDIDDIMLESVKYEWLGEFHLVVWYRIKSAPSATVMIIAGTASAEGSLTLECPGLVDDETHKIVADTITDVSALVRWWNEAWATAMRKVITDMPENRMFDVAAGVIDGGETSAAPKLFVRKRDVGRTGLIRQVGGFESTNCTWMIDANIDCVLVTYNASGVYGFREGNEFAGKEIAVSIQMLLGGETYNIGYTGDPGDPRVREINGKEWCTRVARTDLMIEMLSNSPDWVDLMKPFVSKIWKDNLLAL